jgi:shikimate kinase
MKTVRNLFLVGLMGAGKTTIGRMLARRLKMPFHDTDHAVEQRCGVEIALIFDIEGEAGFRLRESQVIAELSALDGIVLATGGGAVLDRENRRRLAARGTVVYLHARAADLYQRVRGDRRRPLLATPDPSRKLEQLYAERDPLYREVADCVVETGRQSATTLVRGLLERLGREWKLSA